MGSQENEDDLKVKMDTETADAIERMKKGSYMHKIRGGTLYKRLYKLDKGCRFMEYKGSTKMGSNGKSNRVLLNSVVDVRGGLIEGVDTIKKTKIVTMTKDEKSVEKVLSIMHGRNNDVLVLFTETKADRDAWLKGLKYLIGSGSLKAKQNSWMESLFESADKNEDGLLSFKEVVWLLKQLNIPVNSDFAWKRFSEADTNKNNTSKKGEACLDMGEFIQFYRYFTTRSEICDIFEMYDTRAGNVVGSFLDVEELTDFFQRCQKQNLSTDEILEIINDFEPFEHVKHLKLLSCDGFHALLNSDTMDIFNKEHKQVYQDMTQPLNNYFIDSSHNTYCTGDQFSDKSAVEAYIRALMKGCRCVELDVWDGSNDEPVIYHGHTLTSKILLKDTLKTIKTYAFTASQYPVILSIENHLSFDQQVVMANYIHEIFGDQVYKTPHNPKKPLPSPEQLKGMIIIKGKKLPPGDDDDEVSDEDEAADMDRHDLEKSQGRGRVKSPQSSSKKSEHSKVKLVSELSDLVNIVQSTHFKSFAHAKANEHAAQMSSIEESKMLGLINKQDKQVIDHNKRQMLRIYPAGSRVNSSNYDPLPMWCCGCQIVALNYQTPDDPMMVNTGMFIDNGGCGYVLKPEFLRKPSKFGMSGSYPREWIRVLQLKIISGYQLPKKKLDKAGSILDPYVRVRVDGVPYDKRTIRTKVVDNNGFNPQWNRTMEFSVLVPQLAIVYFQVMDDVNTGEDKIVAQFAMPFTSIQEGYRCVHLKTAEGEPIYGASLLVHVNIVK